MEKHNLNTMEKVTNEKSQGAVLAEGEVTGHFHKVKSHVDMWVDKTDTTKKTIRTYGPIEITHEEHDKIEIETPGDYDVSIVNEFDHIKEEAKKVVD